MFRHVKFAELPVVDQDRAVAFYTGTLGLTLFVDAKYDETWRWIEFQIPGAQTKILLTRREGEPRAEPAVILVVEDVAKAHIALKDRGVEFTQDPAKAPWSAEETYALFRDSEGNTIMLGSG
jgi:predicted enzyme related to lactoylglutathione lyase